MIQAVLFLISAYLLALSFVANSEVADCHDPVNSSNTSCPNGSQCWNGDQTRTTSVWSLSNQCQKCLFAQQNFIVVQETDREVLFTTDGSFQLYPNLKIWQTVSNESMRLCELERASYIGGLVPIPVTTPAPAPPLNHSFFLDVRPQLLPGPNFFFAFDPDVPEDPFLPNSCEQGARLVVYLGQFECGSPDTPCNNHGPCVFGSELSTFVCKCPGGYLGQACEEIDQCFDNTVCGDPSFEGVCVDGDCDFSCNCFGGRGSPGGKACDMIPVDCDSIPCLNGGTCQSFPEGDVTCECDVGFNSSQFCTNIDDCASNPCSNGGTCVDWIDGYSCICQGGFALPDCELNIDDCELEPCLHSGDCVDGDNDVTCTCSFPWTGKFCQIHGGFCMSNPCQNDGVCLDHITSFTCQCHEGFTGSVCELDIDECAVLDVCHNGAVCVNIFGGFNCLCSAGYTGQFCEEDINECNSDPCQNDGICIDMINDYHCGCTQFYTGRQCTTRIRSCEFTSCGSGSTCIFLGNDVDPICACPWRSAGTRCDEDIDVTIPSFGHPLDSYLEVNGTVTTVTDEGVVIVMRAMSPHGLVFFTSSQPDGSGDFLALLLNESRLHFQIKIGSEKMSVSSVDPIPLCPWFTVDLRYNGELYVDDQLVVKDTPPGSFSDVQQWHTYLGGVPNSQSISSVIEGSVSGFVGCIKALSISGKDVDIATGTHVVSGQNIGQCPANPCTNLPCSNNGVCEDIGPHVKDFNCTCDNGYSGDTCDVFNPCEIEPCHHGGQCQRDEEIAVRYRCICTALFTGPHCEIPSQIPEDMSFEYSGDSFMVWSVDPSSINGATHLTMEVRPNVDRSTGTVACFGDATTDFLVVYLEDGFVKVSMDLGGLRPKTLTSRSRISNVQFTTIEIDRVGGEVQLIVSDRQLVFMSLRSRFVQLNVGNRFYIGGVPSHLLSASQKSNVGVTNGFEGCIRKVFVNVQFMQLANFLSGYNVVPCGADLCHTHAPCQNGGTCAAVGNSIFCECLDNYRGITCNELFDPCSIRECASGSTCVVLKDEAVCLCPLGRDGALCDIDVMIATPMFNDDLMSFIVYDPLPINSDLSTTMISLSIKPQDMNGLLLYVGNNDTKVSDFLAIGLYNGFVELRYNLGSSTAVLVSRENISLNEWHRIAVSRTEKFGTLILDGHPPVSGTSPGITYLLNVASDLFLGGIDHMSKLSKDTGLTSGFSGCISDFSINLVKYDLSIDGSLSGDGKWGQGVSECRDHPCTMINCQNGGTCVDSNDLGDYSCICPESFVDEFCQTEVVNPCEHLNGGCHVDSLCVFDFEIQSRICQCPLKPDPRTGEFCNEINDFMVPKFKGDSFVEFPLPSFDLRRTLISFSVSAQQTDGLILYVPQALANPDFLAVGIRKGHIEMRLDLGHSELLLVVSDVNITGPANLHHSVSIERNSQLVVVTVDNSTVSGITPGSFTGLNAEDHIYVGGVPVTTSDLREYKSIIDGVYSKGLNGCIKDLRVNGVLLDVTQDAVRGMNVASCDSEI